MFSYLHSRRQLSTTDAAMANRFASVSVEEESEILRNKHSANTHIANTQAVKIFKEYVEHKSGKDGKQWWTKVGVGQTESTSGEMNVLSFEKLLCSTRELDNALNMFFLELRQQSGDFYKLSSFYSIRYGINRHMCEIRQKLGETEISILDSKVFPKSNSTFKAMAKKLKVEGRGGIESHPPIEEEDLAKINKYFSENIENNATTLQEKVFFDIMLHFGRCGRENLKSLKCNDFAVTQDAEGELYVYSVHDESTKNHQSDLKRREGRMWEEKESPVCPVRNYVKYVRLLHPDCPSFFQRPRTKLEPRKWYDNVPVGRNTIGKLMSNISQKAGCSKIYTNHSIRSTCVHLLDAAETPGRHITAVTNHKSESSLKTYTGYTTEKRRKVMSKILSSGASGKSSASCTAVAPESDHDSSTEAAVVLPVSPQPQPVPTDEDIVDTVMNVQLPLPSTDPSILPTDVMLPNQPLSNLPAPTVTDLQDLNLDAIFGPVSSNTMTQTNISVQEKTPAAPFQFVNCNVTINMK